MQQAAVKSQTLCFDWEIAINMQQRLLQPKRKYCAVGLGGLWATSIGSNVKDLVI